MTREEAKEAAEVMLAYANGEKVECYRAETSKWIDVSNDCLFNWSAANYRIKLKEKFDPKTLKPFDRVLARIDGGDAYCWFADFISIPMIEEYDVLPCIMSNKDVKMIIPYNEETEHIIGTSDEAPEYYKYWED